MDSLKAPHTATPWTRWDRVEPDDPARAEVESFISHVYRARYGAHLRSFLPHLLAFRDDAGRLQAAVGLRIGTEGPLFVEQYLDAPAERAIAAAGRGPATRDELVEVGNLAALRGGDARALIVHLTGTLHAAGLRWVLFTATRQLRNAFDRLHLDTVALADADRTRLRDDATDWGRYYEVQPQVLFGDLAAGHAFLQTRNRHELPQRAALPTLDALEAQA
ncbi:thermostable hemolysin [Luteimonas sp. SMYT11W]|uniref:Thermostable hemolysin n=1 Tax=Luteimonas flava TaxID=3115822 RepID=A0ABU7WJL4_9GAMM